MSIGNNYCNFNNKLNPAFGKNLPIKVYGEVSKTFEDEIKTGIKQYPRKIVQKLQKGGLVDEIRLAPKCSDTIPEFPALQRQWRNMLSPGSTHKLDDSFGASTATIPMGYKTKALSFVSFHDLKSDLYYKADRGSVGHELTHKSSESLKKLIGIKMSETESFKEVVSMDLKKLPERLKQNPKLHEKWGQAGIDYTTQKSTPENLVPYGVEEIFAECGAANTTGTCMEIKGKVKLMEVFFPESYKYVQKYLYLLGKR